MKTCSGTMRWNCFILAAAVIVGAAVPAAAANPPLVAADSSRPSAVQVTGGTTYVVSGPQGLQNVACIVFVNHGPRLATKVGLSLAMVDASGTVLGVDVIYPTGKFPVDTRSAFSGGRTSVDVPNGNCHAIRAASSTSHSTFAYRAGRNAPATDVAAILVSAREIVYDDGTAWRTDQVPQTGDHLVLPSAPPFAAAVEDGPPLVSAGRVTASPIEITDAYAVESVVQTGGGPAGPGLLGVLASIPVTSRSRSICMSFANRDAREVKRVRVNLALVDRAGMVAGLETMDSKGPFATAATATDSGSNCERIRGRWEADSFVYEPRSGEDFFVGRVVITPGIVDFVDGTSWTAPNPPVIGAPLALP